MCIAFAACDKKYFVTVTEGFTEINEHRNGYIYLKFN